MKPPVLTYVCGDCGTPVRMSCNQCDSLAQDQHARDQHAEQEAKAWMLGVPGVRALGDALNADITLEISTDEDGETVYIASLSLLGERLSASVNGDLLGHAPAVQLLRGVVADFMRDWAAHIEDIDLNKETTP